MRKLLTDSEGKDIFEGDIISFGYKTNSGQYISTIGTIFYDESFMCYKIRITPNTSLFYVKTYFKNIKKH